FQLLRLVAYQRVLLHRPAPSVVAPGALLHIAAALSSPQVGCCSAIEDCNGSPPAGPDEAGGGFRAWFRGESTARGVRLVGTSECEDDFAGAAEGGEAERDAVDERFQARLRRQDAPLLLQGRGIREERGDVAVGSEAEQLQVEVCVAELVLVIGRRFFFAELSPDAVDLPRCVGDAVEQRALRQVIVGELVVGWNATLVAPPELRVAPIGFALRSLLVGVLRRLAAGERDVPARARREGQPFRDGTRDLVSCFEDDELDAVRHCSPAASSRDRSIAA